MIIYSALLLSIIGVLLAWSANRKNKDLKERLAQANSRVYKLRREIQESQQETEYNMMKLKFEVLKLQGNLKITPEMKIGEVLAIHPQAQQILAGFHIGGCSSCSVDPGQSLGEAIVLNGREPEPILAALNALAVEENNGNGQASAESLKMPNIQLHI